MTIGCCGRSDIARFAGLADLYPGSTREGQRARARLALAMVGARARAQGDFDMLGRVERGFASLGSLGTTSARDAAVAAAVARVRGLRERPDTTPGAAAGAVRDALFTRENAAVRTQLETILAAARAGLGVVEGIVQGEAASELRRAAEQGREPNFTARDVAKALAWIKWFIGGAFPAGVAENDLRLLNSVIATAAPIISGFLELAKLEANRAGNLGLSNALTGVVAYVNTLPAPIAAAVAALPPPEAIPAEQPPAETPPSPVRFTRTDLVQKFDTRSTPALVRCPDGSFARTPAECRAPESDGKKGGGGFVLALPAALLAWYLFK